MPHHRKHYRGNFRSDSHQGVKFPAVYTHANTPLPGSFHERSMGAPVVVVEATIVKYEGIKQSQGAEHQHFLIHIDVLEEVLGAPISLVKVSKDQQQADAFIAVRFGDSMGLHEPIPGLKDGTKLVVRGEYIDESKAYPSPDNPGLAVIHFTHHPVGFIEVGDKQYD